MALPETASYVMTWYALPPLVVGVCMMALGPAVFLRERGSRVSVAFWLMAMTGGLWLAGSVGLLLARHDAVALAWARCEKLPVVFIPTAVYFFTLAIVQRVRQFRYALWGSLAASLFFAWTIFWTPWFVAGIYRYPWGAHAQYGALGGLFLVFFSTVIGASLYLLGTEVSRSHSRTQQARVKAFFWALAIALLGSVDYLAAYGVPLYPFGYLPVFLFIIVAARAIWRYQLVDITPAFAAQQIVSTMGEAVLVVDAEGIIRVANGAACQLFGRSAQELVGYPIAVVDERFFGTTPLSAVMQTGRRAQYACTYPTRSRGDVVLDCSVSALPDRWGHPIGVVCIARDVTERARHLAA